MNALKTNQGFACDVIRRCPDIFQDKHEVLRNGGNEKIAGSQGIRTSVISLGTIFRRHNNT